MTVAVPPPKRRAVQHRGRRLIVSGQGQHLVLGAHQREQLVQSHPGAEVEGRDGPTRPLVGALALPLPVVQLLQPGGNVVEKGQLCRHRVADTRAHARK